MKNTIGILMFAALATVSTAHAQWGYSEDKKIQTMSLLSFAKDPVKQMERAGGPNKVVRFRLEAPKKIQWAPMAEKPGWVTAQYEGVKLITKQDMVTMAVTNSDRPANTWTGLIVTAQPPTVQVNSPEGSDWMKK